MFDRLSQGGIGLVSVLLVARPLAAEESLQQRSETLPPNTADLPPLPPLPPRQAPRRHTFLIPGYLLSLSPGIASRETTSGGRTSATDVASGHGIELSLASYPPGSLAFIGAFAQAQRFFSFNGDHSRYAVGAQGGWFFASGELGVAHRSEDLLRASTTQMHLGVVLSAGFLNIGGQLAIPISGGTEAKPGYPVEGSFVMAAKIPIVLE